MIAAPRWNECRDVHGPVGRFTVVGVLAGIVPETHGPLIHRMIQLPINQKRRRTPHVREDVK
jgi:hypothetical protein